MLAILLVYTLVQIDKESGTCDRLAGSCSYLDAPTRCIAPCNTLQQHASAAPCLTTCNSRLSDGTSAAGLNLFYCIAFAAKQYWHAQRTCMNLTTRDQVEWLT